MIIIQIGSKCLLLGFQNGLYIGRNLRKSRDEHIRGLRDNFKKFTNKFKK